MLTKQQLQGVLISLPKLEITPYQDNNANLGYSTRVRLHFRANEDFLIAIQRSLHQHGINSNIKKIESKTRPRPILHISKLDNLSKVVEILPNLPSHSGQMAKLKKVVNIMKSGEHKTQDGFDKILKLKGVL
tara:strand:+ start:490 stop:885 length:396 start_codon:yes stop_codon:yes gene_type:complete